MAEPRYHVSPSQHRASILKHGLDERLAEIRPYQMSSGDDPYPPGNYLLNDEGAAYDMAQSLGGMMIDMDVWTVDVGGLELSADPQHPTSCSVSWAPIASARLTLLASYLAAEYDWVDHAPIDAG